MPTKTNATPSVTIPQPVPAGVITRTPRAARPTRSRAQSFAAWKSASEDANKVVGYDKTSVIHGVTDIDVLQSIITLLEETPANIDGAKLVVTELLKRKTARAIASHTYRQP